MPPTGDAPPSGFLTDAQRAALDAALANKKSSPPDPTLGGLFTTRPKPAAAGASGRGRGGAPGRRPSLDRRSLDATGRRASLDAARERTHERSGGRAVRKGGAKKGGAGGKWTWLGDDAHDGLSTADGRRRRGGAADADGAAFALDEGDPNWSDSDVHGVSPADGARGGRGRVALHAAAEARIADYKAAVDALLREYVDSHDVAEAAASLAELGAPSFDHFFVKRAVALAADRGARAREAVSALLAALGGDAITPLQMGKGFADLAEAADDLELDVPGATNIIATFMARAIVDDALPPASVAALPPGGVKDAVTAALAAPHAAETLASAWGAAAPGSFDATRGAVADLLAAYFKAVGEGGGSADGAARSPPSTNGPPLSPTAASAAVATFEAGLHRLGVPFAHHEVVKQAARAAARGDASADAVARLLSALAASGTVSASQMAKGFERLAASLDDVAAGAPRARAAAAALAERAAAEGWLDAAALAAARADHAPLDADAALGEGGAASSADAAYKQAALAAVREFFDSADAAAVAAALASAGPPAKAWIFVKHAILASLDRRDREREAVSRLLAEAVPRTVPAAAAAEGFTRLLAAAEDVTLDAPDAPRMLALFLGRAVVDEVLPPSFLSDCLPALRPDALGVSIVSAAGASLAARHAAARLAACWSRGAPASTADLRDAMDALLAEYASSRDAAEAARCVAELGAPLYAHELVKRALDRAATDPASEPAMLDLLAALAASGAVSATQAARGAARFADGVDDLVLDCPGARAAAARVEKALVARGIVPADG